MTQPPATPSYTQPPPGADWSPPRSKRGPVPWLVAAGVALALAVGGVAFFFAAGDDDATPAATLSAATTDRPETLFQRIVATCYPADEAANGYDIGDEGKTLIIEANFAGMPVDTMNCILDKLAMPEAVRKHITTTRALDGQQTDQWPGYTARWTYHPDAGLQLTIRKAQ